MLDSLNSMSRSQSGSQFDLKKQVKDKNKHKKGGEIHGAIDLFAG
jgi:hypothetical protein